MDEVAFRELLKKSGRKSEVIEKYVKYLRNFKDFLSNQTQDNDEQKLTAEVLANYVSDYEEKTKKSTSTILYALIHYFKLINNESMYKAAVKLRETRKVKKSPFSLKKILDIDPKYIEILNKMGIKNVDEMIAAGKSPNLRRTLVKKTDIPYEVILELVKISDLTRVGYVKEKLTRLYYNAGIQTPSELSKWEANDLHRHFEEYIEKSGWDGMVPYLSDLENNIKRAKQLKSVVEYD